MAKSYLPSSEDVKSIIDTEKTDAIVNTVIEDADLLVSRAIANYADDRKKAIVKWVAAHLIASTDVDGIRASEKLGDATDSFARPKLGDLLKGTPYGQSALLLDEEGLLDKLGKAKATIEPL